MTSGGAGSSPSVGDLVTICVDDVCVSGNIRTLSVLIRWDFLSLVG